MANYKVLLVDDEEDILTSIKRIFFQNNEIEFFTAINAKSGLEILEKNYDMDIVISDMRMPNMNGSEFLKIVKGKYPDILRILLTGHSDITDAITAINDGGIYLYLTKPWNKDDLKVTIENSLKYNSALKNNKKMQEMINKQNIELKELNTKLDAKVKERTKQLEEANTIIEKKNENLNNNFHEIVILLTNIISKYNRYISGHSRRVAELVKKMLESISISDDDKRDVLYSAYFHDIGLLGISDMFFQKDFKDLSDEDKTLYLEHTKAGQSILSSLSNFENVSKIIRYHHENFDGTGFPDKIKSESIPLGSRIIAIANNYDNMIFQKNKTFEQALNFLITSKDKIFDSELVEIFLGIVKNEKKFLKAPQNISLNQLNDGMYLMSDIYLKNGVLLIHQGSLITKDFINRMKKFSSMIDYNQTIKVVI